jgi:hypothetical protein
MNEKSQYKKEELYTERERVEQHWEITKEMTAELKNTQKRVTQKSRRQSIMLTCTPPPREGEAEDIKVR